MSCTTSNVERRTLNAERKASGVGRDRRARRDFNVQGLASDDRDFDVQRSAFSVQRWRLI